MAQPHPWPAHAHDRAGLRHLRVGQRFLGRHLRHHCKGRAAGTQKAWLRREPGPGGTGYQRDPGHPDPAVHHHGGLRGGRRCLGHPDLLGGLSTRAAAHGTVHGLHRLVGGPTSRPHAAGRSTHQPAPKAACERQAHPLYGADRLHRVGAGGWLCHGNGMCSLRRGGIARHRGLGSVFDRAQFHGRTDGRHPHQLHDHVHPGRCGVPDQDHGLHGGFRSRWPAG